MSATGSPRTVNVTRSPARTASSTRVVSFRSSLTPTFTCYTVALRPANRRRPHRAPRREPELTTSPRGLRCRYRCPAHAACGRPPHMWAVDISFPRERAGRAWPSCSSRSTCRSRTSTGRRPSSRRSTAPGTRASRHRSAPRSAASSSRAGPRAGTSPVRRPRRVVLAGRRGWSRSPGNWRGGRGRRFWTAAALSRGQGARRCRGGPADPPTRNRR